MKTGSKLFLNSFLCLQREPVSMYLCVCWERPESTGNLINIARVSYMHLWVKCFSKEWRTSTVNPVIRQDLWWNETKHHNVCFMLLCFLPLLSKYRRIGKQSGNIIWKSGVPLTCCSFGPLSSNPQFPNPDSPFFFG